MMRRLRLWLWVVSVALAGSAIGQPLAVDCIAPAKPGGGFDLTCRLAQELLRGTDKPPVRIRYLPGGIGAVAFDRAASQHWSDPNVLVAFSTGSLVNLVQGKFGPHQPHDVRWLVTFGTEYGVVAVRRDSPIQSLQALLALLRKDPAGAAFGASGTVGSQDWIKAALVVKAAGGDHRALRFVSFEGGGQALAALKGSHVDVFCGDAAEAVGAAADVRILAVLAPHRLGGRLAGVPTAREQGADIVWPTVRGLYMGPGVPEKDYAEWVRTMRRLTATQRFLQLAQHSGLDPLPLAGGDVDAWVDRTVAELRGLAQSLHLRVR